MRDETGYAKFNSYQTHDTCVHTYIVMYWNGKDYVPVPNGGGLVHIECLEYEKGRQLSKYLLANNIPDYLHWAFKLVESRKAN